MTSFQFRSWMVYFVAVPFVLVVGYFLAQTDDLFSIMVLGLVLVAGCLPFLLNSHRFLLILSWNATIDAFFLPGQPALWIVLAFVSFFFSIWQRAINRKITFISVPFLTWPLILLTSIVIFTMAARGGVGVQSLGSAAVGSRRYVSLFASIVGYFALSCQPIPKRRATLYASLFFFSGITAAVCDAIYAAGPSFYWLFYVFPPELARAQAIADYFGPEVVFRIEGVAWASVAFFCFMLVRYGAKGVLDIRRPWRLLLLLSVTVVGLLGGFRSRLFLIALFFLIQFCFEGLWRTWRLPVLLGVVLVALAVALPYTDRLPQAVQRAISFLPVKLDPRVTKDAEESLTWRVEMWKMLWPEVSDYLWLGKGYTFSAADSYLLEQSVQRGLAKSYESYALVGEYHNGWLSILLPLGIFGFIAVIWFMAAGWWTLFCNYRYGDSDLHTINTFLLTFYTAHFIFFFLIYGSLYVEFAFFTGTAGLSIALNGGVKRKEVELPALSSPLVQPVPL